MSYGCVFDFTSSPGCRIDSSGRNPCSSRSTIELQRCFLLLCFGLSSYASNPTPCCGRPCSSIWNCSGAEHLILSLPPLVPLILPKAAPPPITPTNVTNPDTPANNPASDLAPASNPDDTRHIQDDANTSGAPGSLQDPVSASSSGRVASGKSNLPRTQGNSDASGTSDSLQDPAPASTSAKKTRVRKPKKITGK